MIPTEKKREEKGRWKSLLEESFGALAWACPHDLVMEGAVDGWDVPPGNVENDLASEFFIMCRTDQWEGNTD